VMIPAFNEAPWIGTAIRAIPREVEGFDHVEVLVVDDGSTDGTEEAALAAGADHVVRHRSNRGLAHAFMTGIETALDMGADVIVNTDADDQYVADDIPTLVGPIVRGTADLVVGSRPIRDHPEFSLAKRTMSRLGSGLIRLASNTDVPDAPSGFRAFSRMTAQMLFVHSTYTYTIETLIQAGRSNLNVATVPVRVNRARRPSRLMRGWGPYVVRNAGTVLRLLIIYRPLRFLAALGLMLVVAGTAAIGWYLHGHLTGAGTGRTPSAVIGTALFAAGLQFLVGGLIADALSVNRKLMERLRRDMIKLSDAQTTAPGGDVQQQSQAPARENQIWPARPAAGALPREKGGAPSHRDGADA
jgi:hypothetical protein